MGTRGATSPLPVLPRQRGDDAAGTGDLRPDRDRWLVRVVPNLYPAFEGDEPFVVANRGPVFTQATAGGIHEILIFSPEHDATWGMLSEEQTSLVMAALRDRLEEHSQRPNLRYTQAIVNSGREAGASLEHPHGQLLGMSFIPRELAEEQARFARFVGSCLLCTTIEAEEDSGERVDLRRRSRGGDLPLLERRALRNAGHPPRALPPPAQEPDAGPARRG